MRCDLHKMFVWKCIFLPRFSKAISASSKELHMVWGEFWKMDRKNWHEKMEVEASQVKGTALSWHGSFQMWHVFRYAGNLFRRVLRDKTGKRACGYFVCNLNLNLSVWIWIFISIPRLSCPIEHTPICVYLFVINMHSYMNTKYACL